MSSTSEASDDGVPTLYRHVKRPRWGYAVLTEELRDRRVFQFQDGRRRTFKESFYFLLEPVHDPDSESVAIARKLGREIAVVEAREERIGGSTRNLMSLADQIVVFKKLHPEGFAGEDWQRDIRGVDAARHLKRHRDEMIRRTQEKLGEDAFADPKACFGTICEILSATDIVQVGKDVDPLRQAAPPQRERLVRALKTLLYGSEAYGERFGSWLSALAACLGRGNAASWPLATALPAFAMPEEQVAVRPTAFRSQTRWSAPGVRVSQDPDSRIYVKLVNMALAIRSKLVQAGLEPKDLIDVYEFIVRTRTRKAMEMAGKKG